MKNRILGMKNLFLSMKISPWTRPDPPRPRKQAENTRKPIFRGQNSISGHEKSSLSMKIRLPSMKNRSRSTKMGPRSRPRPPRPRKTRKTGRKPRKTRKFGVGGRRGAPSISERGNLRALDATFCDRLGQFATDCTVQMLDICLELRTWSDV